MEKTKLSTPGVKWYAKRRRSVQNNYNRSPRVVNSLSLSHMDYWLFSSHVMWNVSSNVIVYCVIFQNAKLIIFHNLLLWRHVNIDVTSFRLFTWRRVDCPRDVIVYSSARSLIYKRDSVETEPKCSKTLQ